MGPFRIILAFNCLMDFTGSHLSTQIRLCSLDEGGCRGFFCLTLNFLDLFLIRDLIIKSCFEGRITAFSFLWASYGFYHSNTWMLQKSTHWFLEAYPPDGRRQRIAALSYSPQSVCPSQRGAWTFPKDFVAICWVSGRGSTEKVMPKVSPD